MLSFLSVSNRSSQSSAPFLPGSRYYEQQHIRHQRQRFDDREYIETNLVEAYEKLMVFVAKHLPDKFYMEDDQRISLRTKIFREVVANVIIHREYTNAQPATFTIYKNKVEPENANNPHGQGPISPNNFAPFPKNPVISKFFIQLGRVDELGSGVLNVNRFIKDYGGKGQPDFIEGNTFKIIVPIPDVKLKDSTKVLTERISDAIIEGAIEGATKGVKEKLAVLLTAIVVDEGKRVPDYKETTGLSESSLERYIKLLKEANLIEFKGESAQTGGYYLTKKTANKIRKSK